MANQDIQGLRVAIIATDGVEQVELLKPREALDQAGAKTTVVSPKDGKIRGWNLRIGASTSKWIFHSSRRSQKTSMLCIFLEA